jgi:hypothetical protein
MIKFGRFSDAFKPKTSLEKWNECERLYKEKKYNESYSLFFDYLKDSETDNVFHNIEGNLLKFQLLQGSKEIRGYSDGSKVTAMVLIADYEKLGVPVMRRLMEMNYTLYYSRFAVRDNKILLKYDSSVLDCSPRKLYYALKEVAVRADKLDDVLMDEFTTLKPFDTHFTNYTEAERDIRAKYFRKWISDALSLVSGLKRDEFTGGISYIYLNQIYKIDFLLQPQGKVINELEKLSWNYFNTKNVTIEGLIDDLEKGLKKLLEIQEEKLKNSFYMVTSTFGISPPSGKEAADNVINSNVNNVKWYLDNNYEAVALNILEYIAGYSLFTYSLNKSLTRILGIIIEIFNPDVIHDLNYGINYYQDGNLNRDEIVKAINEAIASDSAEYPELKINPENLKFDTKYNFAKSLFEEILKLSYK